VESYGFVTVSNTLSDSRANPYNVVDPNGYGWWAPVLDAAHAFYQVMFERPYTVEKIIIKWKTKPPRVEIQLFTYWGKWKQVLNEEPSDDIEMVMSP